MVSGVLFMLIIRLVRPLYRHKHPFLERTFFRTTWQDVDDYYQLLMRASDIPLTAVSGPSGMIWEWLVMPQGLYNSPSTFNRPVTQFFRPHRAYARTYFDDIFAHIRAEQRRSDVDNHIDHLRAVLECMHTNKLYANASK